MSNTLQMQFFIDIYHLRFLRFLKSASDAFVNISLIKLVQDKLIVLINDIFKEKNASINLYTILFK